MLACSLKAIKLLNHENKVTSTKLEQILETGPNLIFKFNTTVGYRLAQAYPFPLATKLT